MKYVSFCLAFFACVVHADVQIKWLADVTADRAETVTGAQSGVVYNASLHMANMSNPHSVTAVQVGTLTSNEIYSILSTISQSGESLHTVTIVDNVDSNCFWRFEGDKIVQYTLGALVTNFTVTLSSGFLETGGTRPAWTNNVFPFTDLPWRGYFEEQEILLWINGPGQSTWNTAILPTLTVPALVEPRIDATGTATVYQHIYYPTNAPVATGKFFSLNESASSSALRSYHYGNPEIIESSSALFTFADSVITDFDYDNYDAVAAGGVVAIPWSIGGIAVTGIAAQAFSPPNENYKISTVYLPRTITAIAEQAFYGCADLRLVVSLGNKPTIGSEAFVNNNALLSFTVPNSTATNWLTNVVSGSVSVNVRRPDVYADKFYERGKSLATVQYVDDTFETKLPPQPENPSLRYLNGWRQWAEKDWMTAEETAEAINNAVGGALEEVNYPVTSVNGMTGDVVIDIDSACSNLLANQGSYTAKKLASIISNNIEVAKSAADAFWPLNATASSWFTFVTNSGAIKITGYNIDGGTDVVIPDYINGWPVTEIGANAFTGSGVTSIGGAGNVVTVGAGAFESCISLASVLLPRVQTVGTLAFGSCASLTSVSLPQVQTVGDYAFWVCGGLTSLYFDNDAPTIGADISAGITPNQVTNYVTNPQATGWGGTLGGMPVVRLPLYADALTIGGVTHTNWPSADVSGLATTQSVAAVSGAFAGFTNSIPAAGCTALSMTDETNLIVTGATYAYTAQVTTNYWLSIAPTAPAYHYSLTVYGTNSCTLADNMRLIGAKTVTGTNCVAFKPFTNGLWEVLWGAK